MNSPPQPDPITTALQLTDAVNGLSARLDEVREDSENRDEALDKYGKQNRRILRRHRLVIIAGIILFLIDVGLTLRIGFVASDASNASASASRAAAAARSAASAAAATRASNLAACTATNAARAQNKQLWDYLLAESRPAPDATPAQKTADERLLAQLSQHVDEAFMPSPCQRLYGARR